MAIMTPKGKTSFADEPKKMECWTNHTVLQRIAYRAFNTDKEKYPWGVPLKDVGSFVLCVRRFGFPLPQCKDCNKEVTEWAGNIKGDRRFSEMVGSFKDFIAKEIAARRTMFVIDAGDTVPAHIHEPKEQEQIEEVPF